VESGTIDSRLWAAQATTGRTTKTGPMQIGRVLLVPEACCSGAVAAFFEGVATSKECT
jgi:hypothetical protein